MNTDFSANEFFKFSKILLILPLFSHSESFKCKMEMQISPAPLFYGSNRKNTSHASAQENYYESTSKRFKVDLTFPCIVCSDVYDDQDTLYEHIKVKHQKLYEFEDESGGENGFVSDSEHELSDEEYLDLSRLLEPICELKQEDDEDFDVVSQKFDCRSYSEIAQQIPINPSRMPMNGEQLQLQIQLQMQIQNYLLQMQTMNEAAKPPKKNGHKKPKERCTIEKPLLLRKK